jgi:hypothetical protein
MDTMQMLIGIILILVVGLGLTSSLVTTATTVYTYNESTNAIDAVPFVVNLTHYPTQSGETFTYYNTSTNGNLTLTEGVNYTVLDRTLGKYNFTTLNGTNVGHSRIDANYSYVDPSYVGNNMIISIIYQLIVVLVVLGALMYAAMASGMIQI